MTRKPHLSAGLLTILGVIATIGAFATDMYLASFTDITESLGVSPSQVQLTLTAFLTGMGLGQLLLGPASDKYGRRRVMVLALGVFALTSISLVFTLNIGYFVALRFVQGLSGRVNWEDVNEIIAAEIAKILGLKTVSAEIAYRNGNRGCLMIHFINQYNADSGETGAALLSAELGKPYDDLKEDNLPSIELVEKSFSVIESLPYFQAIKHDFVAMNIFDLLIGNQDRHPFNWQILFKGNKHFFGPLYDNGASLG